MTKAKIFFHPIDGSGALTISWSSKPKGDATEAKKGDGVGFFSKDGDLLCVIFDEVRSSRDRQVLEFDLYQVSINIKNNQITYNLTQTETITHNKIIKKKTRSIKRPKNRLSQL
jgi:hypothetical protein